MTPKETPKTLESRIALASKRHFVKSFLISRIFGKVNFTMRQIFSPIGWDRKIFVFFAALALLVVLGPFGSYDDFGFWERVVYWTAIMCGVGFFMHVIVTTVLWTRHLQWLNRFARVAIGTTLAGIPGAAIVIFVDQVFRENPVTYDGFPLLWLQVAVMGFFISIIEYIEWGGEESTVELQPVTKFHSKLSEDIGPLVSLSMQDHYVEVTGEQGKELILMRLSDAIDDLEGLDGVRVHRSHWVALDHVVALQKVRQKWSVKLLDDRSLPVSSTYIEKVRAALQ